MNTYSENLRSAVISALEILEDKEKESSAQENLAGSILQHAQSATALSQEKLTVSNQAVGPKAAIHLQAMKANALYSKLVNAAKLGNPYVRESIAGISQATAKLQVSVNAILRLASDVGSVFSLVSATDSGTDIHELAQQAYMLINETAGDGELSSEIALNASILMAEVSASDIVEHATLANGIMGAVLASTKADLDAFIHDMLTATDSLAGAIMVEALREGAFELATIGHRTIESNYALSNGEFNLGLSVITGEAASLSFTVDFELIKSVFSEENPSSYPLYPVKSYGIILVKEVKKHIFSLPDAESLLAQNNGPVINVVAIKSGHVSQVVDLKGHVLAPGLTDADGDPIAPGISYVAFVAASYAEDYKSRINFFDSYLSAPSLAFILSPISEPDKEKVSASPNAEKEIHIKNNPLSMLHAGKEGISDETKMTLDALTIQVSDAQKKVDICQEIVGFLSERLTNNQLALDNTKINLEKAKQNNVLFDQLVHATAELSDNLEMVVKNITLANAKTKVLLNSIQSVLNKLIYSSRVIDKLLNLLLRKKALNPLISDELVSMIITAAKEAGNAVTLTLETLKSVISAQSVELQAESVLGSITNQVAAIIEVITKVGQSGGVFSLKEHFQQGDEAAEKNHIQSGVEIAAANKQLSEATIALNHTELQLKSLHAGLTAANAAALAS